MKTTKNILFAIILFFLSFTNIYSQVVSDEELGFDSEAIKKEILKNNHFIKPEFVETYIKELRKEAELKYKMGFEKWLDSKTVNKNEKNKSNGNVINRFAGCEDYTFNNSVDPLYNWVLKHSESFTNPFSNTSLNVLGSSYLLDTYHTYLGNLHRFEVNNNNIVAENGLVNVPSKAIRIGTRYPGYRNEQISREITLNSVDDFVLYNFAIVLEDPARNVDPNNPNGSHYQIRPYFNVVLRNQNGDMLNCSRVKYEATSTMPGFTETSHLSNIWVRPWASNVIRPVDFGINVGETFTIELSVSDCGAGGHFGYAYFDIQCVDDIIINSSGCLNTTSTISTMIDGTTTELSWSVTNPQGITELIETSDTTFNYIYTQSGEYTINLNVPYFTTTEGCNVVSHFSKTINVIDCPPCYNCTSFDLLKDEKYLVSAWVREEYENDPHRQFKNYENSAVSIGFTGIDGNFLTAPVQFFPSGEIIDGWQRIVGEFVVPTDVDDIHIELLNLNQDGKVAYFDDVRVLPSKGNMKSFVYDQKTQRLMAELDENNYSTFYEYDLEGGLIRVKKETERGVFTIQETRSGNTKK